MPIDLSSDTVFKRNEDVLFSEVADGMSLMNIDSGNYYHFDKTGAVIWKALDGEVSLQSLCETLQSEFDVQPETCRSDTAEFLKDLAGKGLVTAA